MIYCAKCKNANTSDLSKCQTCGANLLPGEGLGSRITQLLIGLVVGLILLGTGVAGSESASFLWVVIGWGLMLIGGLILIATPFAVFSRTPVHQRYLERARRHKDVAVDQAIRDYASAREALPNDAAASLRKTIVTEHAELCAKAGRLEDVRADQQVLIQDLDEKLTKLTGVDRLAVLAERAELKDKVGESDVAALDRQQIVDEATRALGQRSSAAERQALLKARGLSYERLGYIVLGTRDRLAATYAAEEAIEKKDYGPSGGAKMAVQLLGMDNEAFRIGYAGNERKAALTEVAAERMQLLQAALIRAIGFCRQCRMAVELDQYLRCAIDQKHGKPRDAETAFVMPEEVGPMLAYMNQQRGKPHWQFPLPQPHA